jgi:hypothetical protein
VSFLWFSQGPGLSAAVSLSELEGSCLLIAAGTGLLGPQAQKYADLGRLLAQIMRGTGTLFIILNGKEWPDMCGKRPFADASDALRGRVRDSLEPALTRYGGLFREAAIMFVP